MWWEKKSRTAESQPQPSVSALTPPPRVESPPLEGTPRAKEMNAPFPNQTILGRSMVLRGELAGKEDLLIEGQFEGTINLQEHCLTIGPNGQVKAAIHARQVIVQGTVTGDVTAGEKIDIRKTGHVVGGLVAAGIAIEDGADFKGSIEILREQGQRPEPTSAAAAAVAATD